jgi:large subunit ribosomal protein L6
MSKIGRRPIKLEDVKVQVNGQEIQYAGKNSSGIHIVPNELAITLENGELGVAPRVMDRVSKCLWGLHRALLANKIQGAAKLFERQVQIIGLGFKAIPKGSTIEFSLGFSHKIDFPLPAGVTLEVDKTGQLLTFKSADKELLGQTCGQLRFLRPVEPYKGTGIRVTTDVVIRKTGKTKAG